ncbi:MAG: hypothetical protein N2044_08485 [Cyclobacteriaceae bacterium]|nr:hypothetical protein [Cyclobacteriaceae bacterium]
MRIALFLVFLLFFSMAFAQTLTGAWKMKTSNGNEVIKIFSENYFMTGACTSEGRFLYASGGTYTFKGNTLTETYDFFTADSTVTGTSRSYAVKLSRQSMNLSSGTTKEEWSRADEGATVLSGAWRFAARVNDNNTVGERRSADSPRQTIKILSGKHFQWAAFNSQTKQFMGTGGGTYAVTDGKYTEKIRFFSRDDSRSGLSLTFDCRIDGNDWYHKGKGTTGNPVYEVWERLKR